MTKLKISAIICTHNREGYIGAAIDSLLAQDFTDFEVLVVDNGSSDRTREIIEYRLSHPCLKYIWEPTIGLSVARNTGASTAQAEILAYLDDDAIATPQWLSVLHNAYQNNQKLAIAGGKVTLIWPENRPHPNWLSPNLASNLGAYDLGNESLNINTPGLTPRGLNYSIRRSFLEQIGGFDTNLGRIGKKLLSNEELHVTEQALQQGWQVAYLPTALVAHNVAPERIKTTWFLERGWWQGISEFHRQQINGKIGISQLSEGGERLARGVYKTIKYIAQPAQRFENFVYTYNQIGYLSAAIHHILFPAKIIEKGKL